MIERAVVRCIPYRGGETNTLMQEDGVYFHASKPGRGAFTITYVDFENVLDLGPEALGIQWALNQDEPCPECGALSLSKHEPAQVGIVLPLEDGSTAHALVAPDVDPKTVEALTELANAAARAIKKGEL